MRELRAEGLSYREIADHFGTDEHTAYNHSWSVKVQMVQETESERGSDLGSEVAGQTETRPLSEPTPVVNQITIEQPAEEDSFASVRQLVEIADEARYAGNFEFARQCLAKAQKILDSEGMKLGFKPIGAERPAAPPHRTEFDEYLEHVRGKMAIKVLAGVAGVPVPEIPPFQPSGRGFRRNPIIKYIPASKFDIFDK
jgi:hypothetical protein